MPFPRSSWAHCIMGYNISHSVLWWCTAHIVAHLCVFHAGRVLVSQSWTLSSGGLSSTGHFCIMICIVSSLSVFQSLLRHHGGFRYSLVFIRPKHKEHKELTNPPNALRQDPLLQSPTLFFFFLQKEGIKWEKDRESVRPNIQGLNIGGWHTWLDCMICMRRDMSL